MLNQHCFTISSLECHSSSDHRSPTAGICLAKYVLWESSFSLPTVDRFAIGELILEQKSRANIVSFIQSYDRAVSILNSILDVLADTCLIDSIMLAFRLLILVAFLTICSWSTPIDVYDDNDELVLNQIDQPANSCDPLTLKSQDSVVGSEVARIDLTAADSDIQQRDLTATDLASTQLDNIALDDDSPIAFGDNKSPQRSFCPTVPQAVPLRQIRPGKDLCPKLTDALCCHDKATKSTPRPSKSPWNRYSNIQRITDFNPQHLEIAPDRDDEDRYDFDSCVRCMISLHFEY